jgi:nucleoside-diphosphate-sugar epimerase
MTDSLKGKSVCVTGGTGFIGSHLTRRLVDEDVSVSILTNESSSLNLINDIKNKINIFHSDVTDLDSLVKTVRKIKPALVYHLAAMVNVGTDFDVIKPLIDVNVLGTANILKATAEADSVKKLVFISTSDVYGSSENAFAENSDLNPISPYGASKAAAEFFYRCLAAQYNIPWVILRPFIIYGEGQFLNMFIPQLIQSVLRREDFSMTGGEQTRDFLYIDDFVDACIKAGIREEANGEIINIASGEEVSLAEVAKTVLALFDYSVNIRFGALPYRDNERWHVRADINKAIRLLGWEPKTGLMEGLNKTIRWYDT